MAERKGRSVADLQPGDEIVNYIVEMAGDALMEMGEVLAETMPAESWGWYKVGLREYMLRHPEFSVMLEKYLEHSESKKPEYPLPMEYRMAVAMTMGILRDIGMLTRTLLDDKTDHEIQAAFRGYLEKHPGSELAPVVRYMLELAEENNPPPQ